MRAKLKNISASQAQTMLIEALSKKYEQFYNGFPEVINSMAVGGKYSEKAFRRMLEKSKVVSRSPEGFAELQAHYAVELYRATTRRWNGRIAREIREEVQKRYNDGLKEMMKKQKQAEEELAEFDRKFNEELKDEIKASLDGLPPPQYPNIECDDVSEFENLIEELNQIEFPEET